MDMLMLRDRLKPFTNEGFNHVDRRRSKGAKIWILKSKDRPDQQYFREKVDIIGRLREGVRLKQARQVREVLEKI